MSTSGIATDTDDAEPRARLDPDSTARRWSIRKPARLPLPAVGAVIYLGIRLFSLALTDFLLHHGKFRQRGLSLKEWIGNGDGGAYQFIASHGYLYQHDAGQLAHAWVLSFFPGYPAAIASLTWLPGVGTALAGLAVTLLAGMAAAWGLVTLGLKVTGDRRISMLLMAVWAIAPGSAVLSRVHAESLFCALAVWTLVALVDRRWLTAGALALLAGTVHSTAIALVVAVAVAVLAALVQAAPAQHRIALWVRPVAALLLAPLGLLGYWAYVALDTHRLNGWFLIEKHLFHMGFDWGTSTVRTIIHTFLDAPSTGRLLVVLAFAAALGLTAWSLTERLPIYLHAYTITVALMAFTTSANWMSSKPRFILPAFLLALPVARLLAPVRNAVLVPLMIVLTVVSTWFGLYLLVIAGLAS
jgi:hypothetical protein